MTSSPMEVAADCLHYHPGHATAMSEIKTGHDMY